MSERWIIDGSSSTPPYEQLRLQLLAGVRSGELAPGTRLPPVRSLAADLGIAPNTVARTYKELEAEGVLVTAGRRGTVVAPPDAEVSEEARRVAVECGDRLAALGLSPSEAARLIRAVYPADRTVTRPRTPAPPPRSPGA